MNFERAELLQEGQRYWLALSPTEPGLPVFTEVLFSGYTACPAIVVVLAGETQRIRCCRIDLFIPLK